MVQKPHAAKHRWDPPELSDLELNILITCYLNQLIKEKQLKILLTMWSWWGGAYMPVVMVVLRRLPLEGGFDIFLNPVGTTIRGRPTRFPMQTFSQSVALPMNASTVKISLTSWINFPRALCACGQKLKAWYLNLQNSSNKNNNSIQYNMIIYNNNNQALVPNFLGLTIYPQQIGQDWQRVFLFSILFQSKSYSLLLNWRDLLYYYY